MISPGFHQVFTRFWRPGIGNPPGFSPSFHQVLEIHQVFTKFSPGFQVFYQAWVINQEVRIASSFYCSDGRYVILKQAFFGIISRKKTQEAFCIFSWTHKTLLWNETLVDPWQTLRKQLNTPILWSFQYYFSDLSAIQTQMMNVSFSMPMFSGHPMCDGTGKPFLGWWDDDATFMQKCMNVCLFQTRVPAVISPGLQDHTGSYWYADSNFKTLFCEIVFCRRQPPCWFWIFCSCHVLTFHTAQGTCRSTAGRDAEGARLGIAGGFQGDTAIPHSWRFYFHGKSYVSMADLGVPRFRKPPVNGQRIFGFDGVTCTVCSLMTPVFGIPIYLLDD